MTKHLLLLCCVGLVLTGCGSSTTSGGVKETTEPSGSPSPASQKAAIKINQLGFLPQSSKIAIVPQGNGEDFTVVNDQTDTIVFSGKLGSSQTWQPADESVAIADLSSLTSEGQYRIQVAGYPTSEAIKIAHDVYLPLHDAALKAYYFNRASTELVPELAGAWARPLGHPDEQILVHSSASSPERPTNSQISAPKGWYDAGDYNKYIVNSGISTYTLLIAYDHFKDFYATRGLSIPESGDGLPDILNEVKWNLDWMLDMQDPNDGGVYHKLTTLNFAGAVMPHEATAQRYVVQKSTAAALNFAAVMAVASRIYRDFPEFVELSARYSQSAVSAWQWAQRNPDAIYRQPQDVSTGEYGDEQLSDEQFWAASELFLLTGQQDYLDAMKQADAPISVPAWPATSALGYISLVKNGQARLVAKDYESYRSALLGLADEIVQQHQASAYRVAMLTKDFVWGSNATAMNKAMILLQAYRVTRAEDYKIAANGLLDYVLGRNPTDYSFVTGFGYKTPMDIHHRQSYADKVADPVPGFLAGGPQPGKQDKCNYPSSLPAKTYVDDWCSYATNEVTINWNAPLVYVLAGLHLAQ